MLLPASKTASTGTVLASTPYQVLGLPTGIGIVPSAGTWLVPWYYTTVLPVGIIPGTGTTYHVPVRTPVVLINIREPASTYSYLCRDANTHKFDPFDSIAKDEFLPQSWE